MSSKPFDLIVFGATGFTGRQTVRSLARRSAGRPLRWAVAGRNEERLRAAIREMVPPAVAQPGIVVADIGDADSLQALAAQTAVLLNLAGPYALTGEAVVQACIAQGTHCLDLTGETFWVRQLIERQFGRRYSDVQVWRILGSLGWSHQQPAISARRSSKSRMTREWMQKR